MAEVNAKLGQLEAPVRRRLAELGKASVVRRIWGRDPTVWKPDPKTPEIVDRLGWLDVASRVGPGLAEVERLAAESRTRTERVVLCGMGGSSLAPEVLWRTFGPRPGWPALTMLDTTHPLGVTAVDRSGNLARTLYLISSKSGTTQETRSLFQHYWELSRGAGDRFVAITDPGTSLAQLAGARRFAGALLSPPDIGGRYAALSYVGLVPAALIGIDARELSERGAAMAAECGPDTGAEENPGAWLGAVLGEAALAGRDKLTLLLSPRLRSFGLWLEQLVAESTGKEGKGIVPVVGEPLGGPSHYGLDRLFVVISLAGESDMEGATRLGDPVVRITLNDPYDLGAEFFRWEFATAVACAILGVNAFDQPNVAESKANTKAILARAPAPRAPGSREDVARVLSGVRSGDYVAMLAYLPPSDDLDRRLSALQGRLRDRLRVAVTAGYGPRYLHSTGQLHKGGPARGHFILIVPPVTDDLPIPGETFTFGRLIAAQAEGDYVALEARGRPVLWLDGLDTLEEAGER